uniref:Uncharacterized protein n=1 Tax=uncultured prokaryote TaxID=198431 RepID=A0A0H5Q768_9ZZZZ|nr:hypothetical protein [uncultured prokaryote]
MTLLYRVRARWTGFSGAPGYTVLHFRDFDSPGGDGGGVTAAGAAAAVNRARSFFDAIKALLPTQVSINVDPEVDIIEDSTGVLSNSFTSTVTAAVVGTATASYSAATGAVVNWRTEGIRNGRRVRGRSFLVPLASSAFATTGQLATASVGTLTAAASALAAQSGSPDLFVYGRPTSAGATDGVSYVVSNASVPPMGAILTSRRD